LKTHNASKGMKTEVIKHTHDLLKAMQILQMSNMVQQHQHHIQKQHEETIQWAMDEEMKYVQMTRWDNAHMSGVSN